MRGCSQNSPDGPFSLLQLWNQAEAKGRLFGVFNDGDWFHIGTPQALAEAERAAGMKSVFTIGIDRRFADELAAGVLAEHGGDPLALADVLILLPTRRSVRALREAFLRATGGKPTLLPRLAPLGDLDESEWEAASGDGTRSPCRPPSKSAEREALLARARLGLQGRRGPSHRPVGGSGAQARARARPAARRAGHRGRAVRASSKALVEGNFASHWQRTLKFLAIVGEPWPKVLAERGQIDAIDRRTRSIRAQAARWREQPPATPVIAAGSTGSQPATRELLAAIAGLPQGAVVLPGLDREMDEASWEELDPIASAIRPARTSRGAGLPTQRRRRLARRGGGSARHLLITELMRPAETTDAWSRPPTSALEHVTRADCATPHQEALVDRPGVARDAEARRPHGGPGDARPRARAPRRRGTAALECRHRRFGRRAAGRHTAGGLDARAGRRRRRGLRTGRPARPAEASALHLGRRRAVLLDAARRLDRKCLRGLKPDARHAVASAHTSQGQVRQSSRSARRRRR